MSTADIPDVNLRVLYDFAYKAKDDRQIAIAQGEKLFLIRKTNADWWQVIRNSRERPFYVPAMYVEEFAEETTRFGAVETNGNDVVRLDNKLDLVESPGDRILDDRRKPWAVEELMFELTHKHAGEPLPEPEPDYETPDYENIFRDERGNIHVAIDGLDSDGNIVEGGNASTDSCSAIVDFPLSKHRSLSEDSATTDKIDSSLLEHAPQSDISIPADNTKVLQALANPVAAKSATEVLKFVSRDFATEITRPVSLEVATESVKLVSRDVATELAKPVTCDVATETVKPISRSTVNITLNTGKNGNKNYSRVLLSPRLSDEDEVRSSRRSSGKRGAKVKELSESLEKLAQQIQFKAVTDQARSGENSKQFCELTAQFGETKSGRPTELRQHSLEEITSTEFDLDADEKLQTYPNKMMQKVKNKLNYSSSFKTPKEMEKTMSVRQIPTDVRASVSDVLDVEPTVVDIREKRSGNKISPAVPGRKSSLNAHDVKGEANVLDKPMMEQATKLQNIAIGFQNPMYSKVGHSLDNFHDPKVLALHDMLCTDIDEKYKLLELEENVKHKKHSKKKVSESSDVTDNKVRNFHKLKTAIETTVIPEITVDEHESAPLVSGKQRSASKSSLSSSSNSSLNRFRPSAADNDRSRSDSNASEDSILGRGAEGKRRTSLSRNNRVESMKERHQRPPSPAPLELPARELADGWGEYRTHDGRTYYYCCATRDKSWKPPRRGADRHAETEEGSTAASVSVAVPPGWRHSVDNQTGDACYIHDTGAKWFSSSDAEGRVYFFAENSPSSSWSLPIVPDSMHDPTMSPSVDVPQPTVVVASSISPTPSFKTLVETAQRHADNAETQTRRQADNADARHTNFASLVSSVIEKKKEGEARMRLGGESKAARAAKALSMVIMTQPFEEKSPTPSIGNWPNLLNGDLKFLHEGVLFRTKITENGKKVRKNWNPSYVVLTELMLLFFSDIKHVDALRNGAPPQHIEVTVELGGAHIEKADKLSSRKNVYVITTHLGTQLLIQSDSSKTADIWFHKIQTAIQLLPRSESSPSYLMVSPDEKRKGLSRSKSLKVKSPSIEDLTDEKQTKIRARLKKFFVRRPTREVLIKKGIYKDEPMFGRCLADVIPAGSIVPLFVARCVEVIESKEENMRADGLYRVSGNLSQVQKIRLQADQNNLSAIEHEEDVHVLTGALKLFFRELKKPLVPCELFTKALNASAHPDRKEKLKLFRDIVKALPTVNRNTMQYLLQHLLRVTSYKEFNRMHIPNVAIVFGPTLMWSEEETSGNMAIDMMQQNFVIEFLLSEYDSLFR